MKDQASKLREMMNVVVEGQQEVCIPVAVLSCGSQRGEEFAHQISLKLSDYDNKKVIYFNTETNQEDVKMLIDRPMLYEQVKSNFYLSYNEIKENFTGLYQKMLHKEDMKEYIDMIRKIEEYKEVLLYYCGSFINAKAMNLMSLSSLVILIVDGTKESIEMAANVLKIQRKIQQHTEFLILGNDIDQKEMDVILKYLQNECLLLLENHIKGMGSFSIEKVLKGEIKEINRWKSMTIPIDGKSKTLSDRLQLME